MVERVPAVTCHVDIQQPVVVVIGDGNSHAPALACQSCLLRDVLELESIFLVIEGNQRVATRRLVMVDGRVIHYGYVELAIVVAVEQGDAAAHLLDDVFLFRNFRSRNW